MSAKPPDASSEQNLKPRSEDNIVLKPEAHLAPPTGPYRTRWFSQAKDDFGAMLRRGATVGGITGIVVIVATGALFLGGFFPSVSLLPLVIFAAVLLCYFAYVLFRAPAKLDEGKQAEIDRLNATVKERNASIAALESELAMEAEHRARDMKALSDTNQTLFDAARDTHAEKERIEGERDALKGEMDSLKAQLNKLNTYKLTFEIDARRSHLNVISYHDKQYSVMLRLYICFENSDINPLTVRRLKVLLIRKNEDETESVIPLIAQELYEVLIAEKHPLSRSEYKWDDRNLPIEGRQRTLFHTIEGHITAEGDYRRALDSSCFLRVTMEAMNQPPYSFDFDVEWESTLRGWVHITPRM